MAKQVFLFTVLIFLLSCKSPTKNQLPDKVIVQNDTSETIKVNPASIKPIFGYRFQIIGDFNGDGKKDTLTEHFYSNRDHKETNKYFSGIDDMWVLYDSAYKRDCHSFTICSNHKLDTIPVYGVFGPIFLKNEGDLDNDGGDEVSFVPSLEQQSSMNHCHLLSFKNGKWKEIYSFEIREWQIPPLPEAGKTYGLFGMDGGYMIGENDTINEELLKQFNEFPGFITKLKSGKIKIQTFTPYAEETILVINLKKHPKRYN